MKKPLREFIKNYFGITTRRLTIPTSIRRRAKRIDTIVIDSTALTDGRLNFAQSYSLDISPKEVTAIAQRTLIGNTSPRSQLLRDSMGDHASLPYDPVSSHDGTLTHSSWHEGELYRTYWLGEVADIINHTDLTDNEREKLLIAARSYSARGRQVYAAGVSLTRSLPGARPKGGTLRSVGLVSFHYTLHPDTPYAIEKIKQEDIDIIYASTDSVLNTTTLAHLSCLVPATILAKNAKIVSVSTADPVIGGFTPEEKERFCRRFNPATTLFVNEPLIQFWNHFSSLRS